MTYMRKLEIIEAIQWTGNNQTEVNDFIRANNGWINGDYVFLHLDTTDSTIVRANIFDWIIKSSRGAYFILNDVNFKHNYISMDIPVESSTEDNDEDLGSDWY